VTFERFLEALGGLHDATLEWIEWNPSKQTVVLHFDDVLSNFEGSEGYKGPLPGVITLSGVSRCEVEVSPNTDSATRVFSFESRPDARGSTMVSQLRLWPSGTMEVAHTSADFPESVVADLR
jgi:hypothetical protein